MDDWGERLGLAILIGGLLVGVYGLWAPGDPVVGERRAPGRRKRKKTPSPEFADSV